MGLSPDTTRHRVTHRSQESSCPKNLGAILGQEGGSLRALRYLRRSNECYPEDPQTACGLAFAQDSIVPAQKHSQAVLEMEAPEDLHGLAGNGLREMTACELKARGPRKDGGLICGWARRLFRGRSLQESGRSPLRSACWGSTGLHINVLLAASDKTCNSAPEERQEMEAEAKGQGEEG